MESEMKPLLCPSSDCGSDCDIGKVNNIAPTETNEGEYIQLLTSVEEMLAGLAPPPREYSIFRVPTKVRELNEKAYTPHIVSVGPLHRGKPELAGMEGYKMSYLKAFLGRTTMTVQSCLILIRGLEERVRNCYAESIALSSDEFVKMVLIDSGFIIESIIRCWLGEAEKGVCEFVMQDLILLENQLPFFVFDGIFHLAFNHNQSLLNNQLPSFMRLSILCFNQISQTTYVREDFSSPEVKHFVDLLRMMLTPPSIRSTPRSGDRNYTRVRTATELEEAGMKIKCGSSLSKSFLEMNYDGNGVLEIPKFFVGDEVESVLRNLMALELHLYRSNSYIIDCVYFIDALIDRGKDVDILVHNGVIENYTGENETVANIFNDLTTNTVFDADKYYFAPLSESLNSYCMVPRNKWKATLKRDYFSSPIKVVSIVAATTLLVLTLIQTVCSVISLRR